MTVQIHGFHQINQMKIIHINKNIIQYNNKHSTNFPACRVEQGKDVVYCAEVDIKGPSKMVYRPDNPRPCGAKLWIETDAELEMLDPRTYSEFKQMTCDMKELE